MTDDKDFKRVVRERAAKTGESYTTARSQLVGDDNDDQGADLGFARDQFVGALSYFWGDFRPSLRGMTDDEYLWEPVAGCPTIRPQADGTYRADAQFPIHGAASIAQRLCWAGQLTVVDTNQHFGDKSITWADVAEVPGTATGCVTWLDEAVRAWTDALAACDPTILRAHSENLSPGAIDGQFPLFGVLPFHFQLLVQSCAHVSMTRDMYASRQPGVVAAR